MQSLTVPDPRCHPEPYGLTKSDSLSYSSEVPPPPDPLGPDQQQVTAQQRFSDAIRDLHTLAGKPSLREISKIIRERDDLPDTVSHEMVGQLLNGHIPKWSKVESIVRYLSERCLPPHNPDKEAVRFLALWGDATGSGSPAMEAMQEAQQTIIGATAFAERRRELEAKAERNTNEIDTALESFAQGASIDEVLKLANRLRSDSTDEDRRLLIALIRLFVRARPLSDLIEILITLAEAGHEDALKTAIEATASRSVEDLVRLIPELRAHNSHELAFDVMHEVANMYDLTKIVDQAFLAAGQRAEAELLRAFRSRYSPWPV